MSLALDEFKRGAQLPLSITLDRAEHVARHALRVNAHRAWPVGAQLALDERDELLLGSERAEADQRGTRPIPSAAVPRRPSPPWRVLRASVCGGKNSTVSVSSKFSSSELLLALPDPFIQSPSLRRGGKPRCPPYQPPTANNGAATVIDSSPSQACLESREVTLNLSSACRDFGLLGV